MKTILISFSCITLVITSCKTPQNGDMPLSVKSAPTITASKCSPSNTPLQTAPLQTAPKQWDEWAEWVEKRHPVCDSEGHGPDIGSDEWAQSLDRQLKISDESGHGPDIGSSEWRSIVERRLLIL